MNCSKCLLFLVLVVLPLGSTACEYTPAPARQSSLVQALSAMPVGAHHVDFTNWAAIKAYEGFEDVTSASDWPQRLEFFNAVIQRHATPSAYGFRMLRDHALTWGWDTSDLDWETSVSISLPPGYVLKFRDDYDFSSVISHFEEREFSTSLYHGTSIYTHTLDTTLPWLPTTELAVLNTAVLPGERLLIMSVALPTVHAMLDAYQNRSASLADDPAVLAAAIRLNDASAAFISADVCSTLSAEALLNAPLLRLTANLDQLSEQLQARPALHDYATLGVGYHYENGTPVGLIVMFYPDASTAIADLQPRSQLAATGQVRGPSPKTYGEVYFTLVESRVEGNELLLGVKPLDDTPRRLFDMTALMDMLFATCP